MTRVFALAQFCDLRPVRESDGRAATCRLQSQRSTLMSVALRGLLRYGTEVGTGHDACSKLFCPVTKIGARGYYPHEGPNRPITFKDAVPLLRTTSATSNTGLPVTSEPLGAVAVTPVRHQGRPLSEEPAAEIAALARAAAQRRLVIYAGAGLSAAPPACGPTGWGVADRLRRPVATMLGIDEPELATLNLEEIAEVVETQSPDKMDHLRDTAATAYDFRGLEPNYGHEIAALLLREGLLEVVSANWDCAIERAGLQVAVAIAGVATATERLQLAQELPLYKIHGCAKRPQTLALTQSEVDRPQTWAVAQVQSALTAGVVVFVGLGTVGLYVRELGRASNGLGSRPNHNPGSRPNIVRNLARGSW